MQTRQTVVQKSLKMCSSSWHLNLKDRSLVLKSRFFGNSESSALEIAINIYTVATRAARLNFPVWSGGMTDGICYLTLIPSAEGSGNLNQCRLQFQLLQTIRSQQRSQQLVFALVRGLCTELTVSEGCKIFLHVHIYASDCVCPSLWQSQRSGTKIPGTQKTIGRCTQKIENLAHSTIKTDKILLSLQISLMHKLLSVHYSIY